MEIKAKKFIEELSRRSVMGELKAKDLGTALWIETVPQNLPNECESCVELGGVFDCAFAYPYSKHNEWSVAYLFRVPKIGRIIALWAHSGEFYSISDIIPAALWDERKMHEISKAKFLGLADERPIVMHPESVKFLKDARKGAKITEYQFAGTGAEGEFQVPVGPVHAGIIEPGHFRFHVVGEKINKLEVRLSYLHKGIESLAEKQAPETLFPLIEQISGDESVANSVAYAQAVEGAAGIKVPPRAQSLRLVLLELERIYNHLADLGGMSMDIGYYASSSQFLALREEAMRINERLCGSRFMRSMLSIGGLSNDISGEKLNHLRTALNRFSKTLPEVERLTMSSSTFLDRVFTTGRVFPQTAIELSFVGPTARAAGISCDVRKQFPYGAYKSNHVKEVLAADGDVLARFLVKLGEIKESVRLIDSEIGRISKGAVLAKVKSNLSLREGDLGIGICEASRGSCTFVVQFGKSGQILRILIKTASFRNWRAIEKAVKSNILADFPLINKSFNLSYSGADL